MMPMASSRYTSLRGEHVESPRIGSEADLDAPVTALFWCAGGAAFALGDGSVLFGDPSLRGQTRIPAHDGAILAAAPTPDLLGLITGGDDGRVCRIVPGTDPETVANAGRGWVEHVASAPWGAIAWAVNRAMACMLPDRTLLHLDLPSSCGGLAFAPKGQRLAVAHYGGVTLWSPSIKGAPSQSLVWGGSHIGVTWSPDARFLLTPMQESALHGWRLSDKTSMHMGGYPAKPRSLSWSRNGRLLATSGNQGALVWPFKGKDGPMGEQADEFARERSLTTAVAFHPKRDLLAIGYANGLLTLVDIANDRALILRRGEDGAIDHLAWGPDGSHLAYASIQGFCGIMEMEGFIRERFQ